MSTRKRAAGFTLIEAMIIVAVIGILAAVALPMYQDSMRKSRRADAMQSLMELASRQERFYAQNSTYTNNIDGEFGLEYGRTETRGGHYDLRVTQCQDPDGNLLELEKCYVLEAEPMGDQAKDSNCKTLTLDTLGRRQATGKLGDECW